MDRTIVPKLRSSKKVAPAMLPLKVEVPAELKKRLDVLAARSGETLKSMVTLFIGRAVEAEEQRLARAEEKQRAKEAVA